MHEKCGSKFSIFLNVCEEVEIVENDVSLFFLRCQRDEKSFIDCDIFEPFLIFENDITCTLVDEEIENVESSFDIVEFRVPRGTDIFKISFLKKDIYEFLI